MGFCAVAGVQWLVKGLGGTSFTDGLLYGKNEGFFSLSSMLTGVVVPVLLVLLVSVSFGVSTLSQAENIDKAAINAKEHSHLFCLIIFFPLRLRLYCFEATAILFTFYDGFDELSNVVLFVLECCDESIEDVCLLLLNV